MILDLILVTVTKVSLLQSVRKDAEKE